MEMEARQRPGLWNEWLQRELVGERRGSSSMFIPEKDLFPAANPGPRAGEKQMWSCTAGGAFLEREFRNGMSFFLPSRALICRRGELRARTSISDRLTLKASSNHRPRFQHGALPGACLGRFGACLGLRLPSCCVWRPWMVMDRSLKTCSVF